MSPSVQRVLVVIVSVVAIIGIGTIGVAAAAGSGVINACVNNAGGAIKIAGANPTCGPNETLLT